MKNIALLLMAALNVFLYLHPQTTAPAAASAPVQAASAPAPAPAKVRLYYHSPLDAPAMSTSMCTGTGYFSTDPSSVYKGAYTQAVSIGQGQGVGSSAGASAVNAANGGLTWGEPGEAAQIQALRNVYTMPRMGGVSPLQ